MTLEGLILLWVVVWIVMYSGLLLWTRWWGP
jgi:hypothetical protein